jgi:histidinol-phosphate aminotransferase
MLTKTRDSYNLDLISQLIAEAALSDQASARQSWQRVIDERARLLPELEALGFSGQPSQTNFFLVTVPAGQNAEAIYNKLKERHILVRYFASPGLNDKLRISIGTPEENAQLISTLQEIL